MKKFYEFTCYCFFELLWESNPDLWLASPGSTQGPRKIDKWVGGGGGGTYSYIRVMPN